MLLSIIQIIKSKNKPQIQWDIIICLFYNSNSLKNIKVAWQLQAVIITPLVREGPLGNEHKMFVCNTGLGKIVSKDRI